MISAVVYVINAILQLVMIVLIVYVVLSWLISFNIVSSRNPVVGGIWEFCKRVTNPILAPFRRLIPPIAGVDLSVLVVLLLIGFLQRLLISVANGTLFS